jgi:NAD(P)-dependent dehydrogenase (short-subunit alcohol dehydrogenase family)
MVGTANFDYSGHTAIVTGSTKGIGKGIALGLAAADANVVVNARTAEDVTNTAAELNDVGSGDAIGIAADVTDLDDLDGIYEETIEEFGRIDLLVNNAAVWPEGPMHDVGVDEWDRGLDANARGPYYLSNRVVNHMIDEDIEGNVVNITSQAGERHGATHGLYGVSKAAQNGLTWRLAADVAPYGVRVNAVSTSQTDSYQLRKAILGGDDPAEHDEETIRAELDDLAEDIPLRRVGVPRDIANGVLFLASDAASYVTGHILRVSGGNNLQ